MHDDRILTLTRLIRNSLHQLNNVLGVMANSAHLLTEGATREDIRIAQRAIHRGADTGIRLTRVIAHFAELSTVASVPVDLQWALPDIKESLDVVLSPHMRLGCSVQPGTLRLHAEFAQLELLLAGLVLDAREWRISQAIDIDARNATPQEMTGVAAEPYVRLGLRIHLSHSHHRSESEFDSSLAGMRSSIEDIVRDVRARFRGQAVTDETDQSLDLLCFLPAHPAAEHASATSTLSA